MSMRQELARQDINQDKPGFWNKLYDKLDEVANNLEAD